MYQWEIVREVECARNVLNELSRLYELSVATNAEQSNEQMVLKALNRVEMDKHIQRVFTSRAVGKKKNEREFWISVSNQLEAKAEEILVVGDSFQSDVMTPTSAGMQALWYNSRSGEKKEGMRYRTIHNLSEITNEAEQISAGNADKLRA